MHLDASEKDTMHGSEPSSVPFTYKQPRMGKRRIDITAAGTSPSPSRTICLERT